MKQEKNRVLKLELRVILLFILMLTLVFGFGFALIATASDISHAQWYGNIIITNNSSSSASAVSGNFSANTSAMISTGFLNSSANNCAMQDSLGNDVAFMPGYGSNPWCIQDGDLTGNQVITDTLYTGNVTDGKIRYFPGSTGMNIPYSTTMDPSTNFTIKIPVRVDPTASSSGSFSGFSSASDGFVYASNAVYATARAAATGTLDATATTSQVGQQKNGNYYVLRSYLYASANGTIPIGSILNSASLYLYGQNDLSTTDFNLTITNGQPIYPHEPLVAGDFDRTLYSGDGGSASTSGFTTTGYFAIPFNSTGLGWISTTNTTKLCLMSDRDIAGTAPTGNEVVYYYNSEQSGTDKDPYLIVTYTTGGIVINKSVAFAIFAGSGNITAAVSGRTPISKSVSSGEHEVIVYADGTNYWMTVDGSPSANASIGSGVPVNTSNLTIGSSATPYMGDGTYIFREYVGGNLVCDLNWEYGATFQDQTTNNNDGTPSFRTTSSDADVSAYLATMLPVTQAKASVSTVAGSQAQTTAPPKPSGFTSPTGDIHIPIIGSLLKGIIKDTAILAFLLYFFSFLIIWGGGILSVRYGKSIVIKAVVMGALMLGGALSNVYGIWTVVVFGCYAFGILVMSRHYGFG